MCRVALIAIAAEGLKFLKFAISHGIMMQYLISSFIVDNNLLFWDGIPLEIKINTYIYIGTMLPSIHPDVCNSRQMAILHRGEYGRG
jgi:hypothetical protein